LHDISFRETYVKAGHGHPDWTLIDNVNTERPAMAYGIPIGFTPLSSRSLSKIAHLAKPMEGRRPRRLLNGQGKKNPTLGARFFALAEG